MDTLNPEFQTELAKAILQDHAFLPKHRRLVNHKLFKDKTESEVMRHALDYYDKYKCVPFKNVLLDYMSHKGYDIESLDEGSAYLFDGEVHDLSYIADSLQEFSRKARIKDTLLESMDLLKKGDYASIYRKIKESVVDYEGFDDVGSFFWDDVKSTIIGMDRKEEYIPTGISDVDNRMSGGAIRGTENVIVTPPNKGKTTILINIGKYAVLNGFKVVHYSLELSAEIIKRRYIMSMVRMTKNTIKAKKKTAYNKVLELAEGIQRESLIVKRYKASTCTVQNLYDHLNSVRDKLGFIPDVVIVDYGDLIKPSHRYDQKRHELAEIYSDLRDMAIEFNLALWTATQTNRAGNQDELITINELSECFEKAAIADVIISANQTLEEKRNNEARLFFAKNRDDESLVSVNVETDWAKAYIGGYD